MISETLEVLMTDIDELDTWQVTRHRDGSYNVRIFGLQEHPCISSSPWRIEISAVGTTLSSVVAEATMKTMVKVLEYRNREGKYISREEGNG
jgi:hypothetical protein